MLDNKKDYNYFDLGKFTLWANIKKLQDTTKYTYYHWDSCYDGSRDINGLWINVDNHISKNETEFINKDKLFFVFLENNKFSGSDDKYNFFSKLTKDEILKGDYWICDLFRDSLIQ
jgi:hypothetical protein